jgi:regulator of sigma E protease
MIASTVAAIVVLGFLILIHECGHFFVAKRMGVKVLKFSIGFGPRLLGTKSGETEYVLSAIPFGGFVKMVGEDPDEEIAEADREVAFPSKSLAARAAIVLAGPSTNIVGAFLLFSLVFIAYGVPMPSEEAKVGGLSEGMPAASSGLKLNDTIKAVDGVAVSNWIQLTQAIRSSGGQTLKLDVERDGQPIELQITPKEIVDKTIFNEELPTKTFVIGVEPVSEVKSVDPGQAVWLAAQQTWIWTETIVVGLYKMATGSIPAKEIGGPLEIARQAGKQAAQGLERLLMFTAVISLNLGLLNLLPIPILDGGHLLFIGIEAVMRRPLELRHRELAQQAGLFILLGLMAFAFYNDILRVVGGVG